MSDESLSTIKKLNEGTEHISSEEFEFRIKEIAKCKRDIIYFAEKYFHIINLDKGLIVPKLYPKQKDLLKYFVDEDRCIVMASRQSSKTTTYTIFLLWQTIFFPEKKIMVLANKADTAEEIISRIKLGYEYLPLFLKPSVLVWNKGEVIFNNKSTIKGFATASDSARGFSANIVVADEFAFVPNNIADKVFTSIFPVISSSKKSKFIIVSTPNGADRKNLYYDIWCKATNKDTTTNEEGWKAFRFDWWDVPGRDEVWKAKTIASIGKERFAQEFGNEFLTKTITAKLIPDDIVEQYRKKQSEYTTKGIIGGKTLQIISEADKQAFEFTMWHEFNPSHTYLASADVAEGSGGDSSILYIFDITDVSNITQCAMFASASTSTVQFAYVITKILSLYNNPYFVCETNGVGASFIDTLRITYNYSNVVMEGGAKHKYGITSQVHLKGRACLWLKEMFTTEGIGWTLYDPKLLDEMSTFIKKDSKMFLVYNAMNGAHDDRIMTLVWAAWILNPEIVENYYIVGGIFKTSLDKILPKLILPLQDYNLGSVASIKNDPIYEQFLTYKNEMLNKLSVYNDKIHNKHTQLGSEVEIPNNKTKLSFDELYFGGDDDSPSWNGVGSNRNPNSLDLNSQSSKPTFYIC